MPPSLIWSGCAEADKLFVVDDTTRLVGGGTAWRGRWMGRRRRFTTTTLPRSAAQHTVRMVVGRIEPLTMWQGWRSGGLPDPRTPSRMCCARRPGGPAHIRPVQRLPAAHLKADGHGRLGTRGGVGAHMLRHTAAVRWMVELEQELQRRRRQAGIRTPGLPPGSFNTLLLVQAWLRHRRYSTTERYQTCYLSRRWVERNLGASLRLALSPKPA